VESTYEGSAEAVKSHLVGIGLIYDLLGVNWLSALQIDHTIANDSQLRIQF
jgi:hypothetical protein